MLLALPPAVLRVRSTCSTSELVMSRIESRIAPESTSNCQVRGGGKRRSVTDRISSPDTSSDERDRLRERSPAHQLLRRARETSALTSTNRPSHSSATPLTTLLTLSAFSNCFCKLFSSPPPSPSPSSVAPPPAVAAAPPARSERVNAIRSSCVPGWTRSDNSISL